MRTDTDGALAEIWRARDLPGDPPTEDALAAWITSAPDGGRALKTEGGWQLLVGTGGESRLVACGPASETMSLGDLLKHCRGIGARLPEGVMRPLHAYARQPSEVEPYRPARRASLPRLHLVKRDDQADLPVYAPELPQVTLPRLESRGRSCPSWLLWLYDQAGGDSLAAGRGAPWDLRLFVAALLHLAIRDRDGRWHTIRVPTNERAAESMGVDPADSVVRWLHPDGWANERRDWHRLPEALHALRELAHMPVEGTGSVTILFPSVIPALPSDPLVEFTARIPPSAGRGDRIDWPTLLRYGQDSAALYRAYLSVSAHLGRFARNGRPVTAEIRAPRVGRDGEVLRDKRGRVQRSKTELIANRAARYSPRLSDRDLATMIGYDADSRQRRRDARRALDRLHADSVIDLRTDGRGTYQIFGPPDERKG